MTGTPFNIRSLNLVIPVFVIFLWSFTTLHLLLFGSDNSSGFIENLAVIMPDLFLLFVFVYGFLVYRNEGMSFIRVSHATVYDKIFLAYFIISLLQGLLLSLDLKLSIYGFRITYLPMIFYFLGRVYAGTAPNQFAILLKRIFFIFVCFAIAGLVIYFAMPGFQNKMMEMTGYPAASYFILRMTSVLWTPVLFGFLMAMALVYYYFRILTEKKYINYLFFSICWICLFLTVSRGPILAFLLLFLIMSFFFRNWRASGLALGSMVLSTFIVNTIIFKGAVSLLWIFQSAADTASFSDGVTRVMRWKISLHDLSQQPWGFGLGKAGATAYRFLLERPVPSAPYSTDGWYLKLACESGIQGLLAYLIIGLIYFFRSVKFAIRNKNSIVVLALAMFILVSIHAVPSNTLDYHPFISIYWLIIGYSAGFIFTKENEA